MNEEEFFQWKRNWFKRIPKCIDFACCHELSSCAIKPLCGCGSIFQTYQYQIRPEECFTVDCSDCLNKHECTKENNESGRI